MQKYYALSVPLGEPLQYSRTPFSCCYTELEMAPYGTNMLDWALKKGSHSSNITSISINFPTRVSVNVTPLSFLY